MRALVFLLFASSVVAQETTTVTLYSLSSYADGKQFRYTIREPELDRSPAWTPDSAYPPFSARKAGELARKQINELVSDGRDWRLKAISMEVMRDQHHWIYVVEFEPPYAHPDLNR